MLGEGLDVGLLADVGVHGQHVDAATADLLGRRGQRVVLHVGEDEIEAGGGEPLGQRQPDPAAGARDDTDLSLA